MSQPPLQLDAETERVAVSVLRHLEWQDSGFSLIFLFADVGSALQLADWLDQRLALQGRSLQRVEARDNFVREPEAAVDNLVAGCAAWSVQAGAVWWSAARHPSDAAWGRARTLFLARLNERRFLLERDLLHPLVLVFPVAFKSEARAIAPDIWHKRDMSATVRSFSAPATGAMPAADLPTTASIDSTAPLTAYAEWQRMQASGTQTPYLATGWAACAELLAAGRPADAEDVAVEVLSMARRRAAAGDDPAALRDLSVSLDSVGSVARAQGDWAQAEAAYRESLALSRQLVDRLGGTPEALRDLSVSLDRMGGVARAQGDWAQAGAAYRESLALGRQRVDRLGGTPEALRDLSVSLNSVGDVACAQGDWAQAEAAHRESLALRRQLVDRLGGTPEALRDLSVSLDNVGDVARAQGDWAQAEVAYREGLTLRRQLVYRLGGTPEALRDLLVALNRLGGVARAQDDWAQAEAAYRENLALCRQLVERLGATPDALDDLAVSLLNMADLPSGDPPARAEALQVRERLATQYPDVPRYAEALAAMRGDNQQSTASNPK